MSDLFGAPEAPALALARKWRPRRFADLKGQEHVVQALSNALSQGRLHHAYLFTGTRGVGKTTLARILAKCFNCETGVTAEPCGLCSACRQIEAGHFVDLLELDAASNTGVDNMREVLDNAQYAPTAGRYKIYIIDEVHMLSRGAFNSMLKTLEEPPEHVKFILATTDPQKIPVTVLSRCLQFNLKPMSAALVAQHLGEVLEKEDIPCEAEALNLLARAAQGSMRDALSLTDQAIAYSAGDLRAADIEAMLGSVRRDYLFDLLDALADADGPRLMAAAQMLAERGIALEAALQELAALVTQLAVLKSVPDAVEEGTADLARMRALVVRLDAETLQLYYQIAVNGRRDLPYAPDEAAGFTMSLLRMLAFTPALEAATEPEAVARPKPEPPRVPPLGGVPGIAPAPPPARQEAVAPSDWPALVDNLGLTGMARMLAEQCELKEHAGGKFILHVPAAHKSLLERSFRDKLVAALRARLGDALQVEFAVIDAEAETPAQLRDRARKKRQAEAVTAIESDPFVNQVMEIFDASIVASSIKPIGGKQ